MGAPKDPHFYVDLDAMSGRVGAKSEDLLLIWTSESDITTTLAGVSRTFSTLMHASAVPGMMSEGTWERLPTMTAAEQLPYVEKIYQNAHRTLGRPFKTTFETYLANAAPALLRPDGNYNPASVMYEGGNYPDNWTMDNAPAGMMAALKDNIIIRSPRDTYEYAKTLVQKGVLKGYVSLGDLQNFGQRVLNAAQGGASSAGTYQTALRYLKNVRDNVALGNAPSIDDAPGGFLLETPHAAAGVSGSGELAPSFDDGFTPGAPLDTRVASPEKARKDLPDSANVAGRGIPMLPVVVGGVIAGILALVSLKRK